MSKTFKPLPEQISEKMIAAIKDGKSIFEKPMNTDGTSQFVKPFNPSTGNKYVGPAALILMMQDKDDPRWMTSNQASYNKTHVLKGSKGTLINFFSSTITKPVIENGEPALKENGKPKTERVTLDKPQLVDAWLYNGENLNDMPEWIPEPQRISASERAQNIIDASNAFLEKEIAAPFYNAHTDLIFMPGKEQFPSPELYYSAALHELTHWTGHENRLNRQADPAGNDLLLKEELRANIASFMISAELDLPYDLGDHVGYLNGWAQVMKDNPNELFKAAADAQKIADYVLGLEEKRELKQEVENPKGNVNKLMKDDVIAYNGTEYKVLALLKNKVYQMQDLGTEEKFKMSPKNGLYNSLLEAKKNPQALDRQQTEEQDLEQQEEEEPVLSEEVTTSYKMKR